MKKGILKTTAIVLLSGIFGVAGAVVGTKFGAPYSKEVKAAVEQAKQDGYDEGYDKGLTVNVGYTEEEMEQAKEEVRQEEQAKAETDKQQALEQARQEAEAEKQQAVADAKEEGRQTGFEEGYEQGKNEAGTTVDPVQQEFVQVMANDPLMIGLEDVTLFSSSLSQGPQGLFLLNKSTAELTKVLSEGYFYDYLANVNEKVIIYSKVNNSTPMYCFDKTEKILTQHEELVGLGVDFYGADLISNNLLQLLTDTGVMILNVENSTWTYQYQTTEFKVAKVLAVDGMDAIVKADNGTFYEINMETGESCEVEMPEGYELTEEISYSQIKENEELGVKDWIFIGRDNLSGNQVLCVYLSSQKQIKVLGSGNQIEVRNYILPENGGVITNPATSQNDAHLVIEHWIDGEMKWLGIWMVTGEIYT